MLAAGRDIGVVGWLCLLLSIVIAVVAARVSLDYRMRGVAEARKRQRAERRARKRVDES